MRNLIALLVLLLTFTVSASENRLKELTSVGRSSFSVWFWDVYDIELKTPNGIYVAGKYPLTLELTYKREISRIDLVEETLKQWQRFELSENNKKNWAKLLLDIWPNVKAEDKISFYIDNTKVTYFYFNQQFIGKISQADFSEAFSLIWLDQNGPYPEMTRELIGLTKAS